MIINPFISDIFIIFLPIVIFQTIVIVLFLF